ncbi:hypothetical protein EB796_009515 [Bugula neritina]|uniref:Uncharacterized protein n=1 Tax=Bugula neritina TaxID=10212 RepID=A0A7J7K0N4_BUGNE|nr:hypothetical protein EB796_009515 [Bugula neritina]
MIFFQAVEFDDIVCAYGSGRTVSGLAIANYLCGMPYRLHGIVVGDSKEDYYRNTVQDHLNELGLHDVSVDDVISLYFDYVIPEYGMNIPCQLELMAKSAAQTGVILDNTYTAKAAFGLKDLMQNKPEVFKGKRVLFLHTELEVTQSTQNYYRHFLDKLINKY